MITTRGRWFDSAIVQLPPNGAAGPNRSRPLELVLPARPPELGIFIGGCHPRTPVPERGGEALRASLTASHSSRPRARRAVSATRTMPLGGTEASRLSPFCPPSLTSLGLSSGVATLVP